MFHQRRRIDGSAGDDIMRVAGEAVDEAEADRERSGRSLHGWIAATLAISNGD